MIIKKNQVKIEDHRRAFQSSVSGRSRPRRHLRTVLLGVGTLLLLVIAAATWLGTKASTIHTELNAAIGLISEVKAEIADDSPQKAAATVTKLRAHTTAAREAATDPLWSLGSILPLVGPNMSAAAEVARSADDVATLGLAPLITVLGSLDWESVMPSEAGANMEPLKAASPTISSAANAIRLSAERLQKIDSSQLLPQVADPLLTATEQLHDATGALDAAASASQLVPAMLGSEGPRNFLLIIQNNAEARASGGIPGALALLTLDHGKLTLSNQTSAGAMGSMTPPISLEPTQEQIYSPSMGVLMQDVNMTPDFPSAASTAQLMWEQKFGLRPDGVISIDPVALSYVLQATGPVALKGENFQAFDFGALPEQLSAENVVQTLLSDVYAQIDQPKLQDVFFATAAQEVFLKISSGGADPKQLMREISRGVDERRIAVWSGQAEEQAVLSKYVLSGAVSGPSIAPAEFGVFFNDGTGAKMDYYVEREVQVFEQCGSEGYREAKVRVTSTNKAPHDSATSLPTYVTGGGAFGVPPGSVQTNVVAYGPVQSNIATALVNGSQMPFAAQRHDGRPVGTVTVRLEPGASSTVEFTFGSIVQHAELGLRVTPTVRPEQEVVLPSKKMGCNLTQ